MLKKILLCVAFCALGSLAPAARAQDATAAVTTAVEKLRVAMVTPNAAALKALVADDLSYGHSDGHLNTKDVFISDLMTGVSHFLSIELTEQTVRVVGDCALVRHILSGATHDQGKPEGTVKLKVLMVWQNQGGEWKLLARQAVRI
jgi:ketosteroid isomerase-like protein